MTTSVASGVTVCRRDKGDLALHAYQLEVLEAAADDSDQVDVVMVHGLTGHALKTWDIRSDTAENASVGWVTSLAIRLAGRAKLWTVGYPAPLFADGRTPESLEGTGSQALRDLCALGLGERKVIFVAHSLGGILVKAMLCEAIKTNDASQRRLLTNTHAVVFAGTPHSGSNLSRWRRLVPWAAKAIATGVGAWLAAAVGGVYLGAITLGVFAFHQDVTLANVVSWVSVPLVALVLTSLFAPSRQVLALDPDNPALFDLTANFRRVVAKFAFGTSAFFERRRLWRLFLVVPRSSADPGLTNCRQEGIDANHISMCKDGDAGPLSREIEHQVVRARRGKDSAVFENYLGLDAELRRKLAPLLSGSPQLFVKKFGDAEGDRASAERALRNHLRQFLIRGDFEADPLALELARTSEFDIDVFVWQVWQEQRVMEVRRALRDMADQMVRTWPAGWKQRDRPTLIPFYRTMRTIEHIYRGDIADVAGRAADCAELAGLISVARSELNTWCSSIHGVKNDREWSLDGDAGTRRLLLRMQCTLEAMAATCEFFERETRERYSDMARNAEQLQTLSQRFRHALNAFEGGLDLPLTTGHTHPQTR